MTKGMTSAIINATSNNIGDIISVVLFTGMYKIKICSILCGSIYNISNENNTMKSWIEKCKSAFILDFLLVI